MRPAAAGLDDVLAGPHSTRWTARVLHEWDRERLPAAPLTNGRLSFDADAQVCGTGSATIALADVWGKSHAPTDIRDALSPYGNWLELTCHVDVGGFHSETIVGKFEISTPQPQLTGRSRIADALRTTAETIQLRLDDAFLGTKREPVIGVEQAPVGGRLLAELERLLGLPVRADDDAIIEAQMEYPADRLAVAFDLAQLVNAVPYMRWDGTVGLRTNEWPSPVLTLTDGKNGLLSAVQVDEWDSKDVYNEIVVETEDNDQTTLRSRPLRIEEGPLRYGLRRDGAWGRRSKLYKVKSFTRQEQVDQYAAERFAADTLPRAVGVSWSMPVDPRLEPGDVVTLATATVSGVARIKTVSIDVTSPTMKVSAHLG